jgi:hypothetical protein
MGGYGEIVRVVEAEDRRRADEVSKEEVGAIEH